MPSEALKIRDSDSFEIEYVASVSPKFWGFYTDIPLGAPKPTHISGTEVTLVVFDYAC